MIKTKSPESHAKVYRFIQEIIHYSFMFFFTDPSTEFANCTTGDVRLTDFMDNPNEDSRQGTAQICVNNAWGSVCRDDYFDNTDAAVFCSQLQGFVPDGKKQLLIYF